MPVPSPTSPIPSSGRIQVRVRYCECDPMGVAHHAAYIPWLEIGRTEILRDCGVTYADLERAGVFLVIAKLDVRYRRPIYYDDLIDVRTNVTGGSRVKIEHEYEVVLAEDGRHNAPATSADAAPPPATRSPSDVLAIASTTLACVDTRGKIQVLPEWLART